MIIKIGYVIKILNNNIKIINISYHIYNFKYKRLLIKNICLTVYDKRNELLINDFILYKYYKKSKYCKNIVIKIL